MTARQRPRSGPALEALLALLLPGALAVGLSLAVGEPVSDWEFARAGAQRLLDGHLTVYADLPQVQMGPLALLLAGWLPGPLYLAFLAALLPVVMGIAALPLARTRRTWLCTGIACALLAWPWAAFGVQGHADDALVAAGAVGMVTAVRAGHGRWLVVAFAVAIAAKPTAVLLLPLALLHSRRTAVVAGAVGGALWLPFVLSDVPGFLAAGHGQGDLWEWSLVDLLGGDPHSGFPSWLRPVQLLGGLVVCWSVARTRGAASAVLAVVAFRVLTEPATWNYYASSVVVAAAVWDLHRGSRLPRATVLAFVCFLASSVPPLPMAQGVVRLVCLGGLLALACLTSAGEGRAAPRRADAPATEQDHRVTVAQAA